MPLQLPFTEDFEGGTDGADVTTSNTGFNLISSNAPTFTTSNPFKGSLAMHVSSVSGPTCAWAQPDTPPDVIYARFSFRLNATPTTSWYIFDGAGDTSGDAYVRVEPDGSVLLRDGTSTTVWTSTTTLATATHYQIQVGVDTTAGTQSISIYDSDGTLLDQSGDKTFTGDAIAHAKFGSITNVSEFDANYDAVKVDTTPPGPIVSGPTTTYGPHLYYGGSWIPA